MNKFVEGVKEFHKAFDVREGVSLDDMSEFLSALKLRMNLMREELDEFGCACENYYLELFSVKQNTTEMKNHLVGMIDGITDLLYVVVGTALVFGIPLERAFDEVQRSNMSKLGADGKPVRRADGKVLKGPGFFNPRLENLVEEEGSAFRFAAEEAKSV